MLKRRMLGLLFIASPFIVTFILGCQTVGFIGTLKAFGLAALIVAVVSAGVCLIF
jgi:hypothetical protein